MQDINFCGYNVENKHAPHHFLIVGKTGSGKTNILRMMMRSALLNVMSDPDYRAVVYDQKQDMVSIVRAQGVTKDELRIMNPYDWRCYEWDMAKDITGQDTSFQIASIFIPEENSQNRYFSDAARALLAGVMNVFIEKGIERKTKTKNEPDWRLADVLYTMRSQERVEHVLKQTPETEELIALHLRNDRTTAAILSTLDTRMMPFTVPAALWRKAGDRGRKLSLEAFVRGRYVMVLGNNQQARRPLQALNQILFQRITELTLGLPDTNNDGPNPRRIWFFLDEVRKIGKLDGLDDLMTNGRSKGAAVVLAFQDVDGMRHVYQKEIAHEITGMCGNYCFLKMSGTETPLWASQTIGEFEEMLALNTENQSIGDSSAKQQIGTNQHIHKSSTVLPSMLTSLPYPSREQGIQFYASIPSKIQGILNCTGEACVPGEVIESGKGPEPDPAKNLWPWPRIGDYHFKQLPRLQPHDCERLGIPMFPQRPAENPSASVDESPPAESKTETGRKSGAKRSYRTSAPSPEGRPDQRLEDIREYNGL